MQIEVLFFGITKDIVGRSSIKLQVDEKISVGDFKKLLNKKYSGLENINSYAIAVNEAYAEDSILIKSGDIVAIIPPVSGG